MKDELAKKRAAWEIKRAKRWLRNQRGLKSPPRHIALMIAAHPTVIEVVAA